MLENIQASQLELNRSDAKLFKGIQSILKDKITSPQNHSNNLHDYKNKQIHKSEIYKEDKKKTTNYEKNISYRSIQDTVNDNLNKQDVNNEKVLRQNS